MKLKLLQYYSRRYADFSSSRIVRGIRVRPKLKLVFTETTPFLGQIYPPGIHEIAVSQVLGQNVEYGGPKDIKKFSGIELHFRDSSSAGTVSRDAWTLLDALGIPQPGQHAHIPAKLPIKSFAKHGQIQAARMGEFVRRVNLVAELITIVRHGYPVWKRKGMTRTDFGPLRGEKLKSFVQDLIGFGSGDSLRLKTRYKIAYVGIRGEDFYDEPDLWGLEYRTIVPQADHNVMAAVLDAIQWAMAEDDYGLSNEQLMSWGASEGLIDNPAEVIANSWYNHSWGHVFSHAPYEIQRRLKPHHRLLLRMRSRRHEELKMLVHDWTKDPLFFGDNDKQNQILAAQMQALDKIFRLEAPVKVVREFLISSGLYEWVPSSLGLELP